MAYCCPIQVRASRSRGPRWMVSLSCRVFLPVGEYGTLGPFKKCLRLGIDLLLGDMILSFHTQASPCLAGTPIHTGYVRINSYKLRKNAPSLCCCGTHSSCFQSGLSISIDPDVPVLMFSLVCPEHQHRSRHVCTCRTPLLYAAEQAFSVIHERAWRVAGSYVGQLLTLRVRLLCFGRKNQSMGASSRWHRSGCPLSRTPALRVESVLGTLWLMAPEQKQDGTSVSLPVSAVLVEA